MYQKNEGLSENDRIQNKFSAYVSTSIHRERMLYLKRKVRRLELEIVLEEVHFDIADTSNFVDDLSDNENLTYALKRISEKERQILFARVLDGKDFSQIADEIDMNSKTVSTVYYRAIVRFALNRLHMQVR